MSELERLETTKHLIAYIDILSGKGLILNDSLDNNLNTINKIYNFALNFVNTMSQNSSCDVKIKIFSDNILITLKPLKDDSYNVDIGVNNFLCLLSFLQIHALNENILLRGGVTVGDICINKVLAWGTGLISAIKLEEENAIYPRIIIDREADNIFGNIYAKEPSRFNFPILQDHDGWRFIDYLGQWGNHEFFNNNHLQWRNFIVNELSKNLMNAKVMKKLLWQVDYYNHFVTSIGNPNMQIAKMAYQGVMNA